MTTQTSALARRVFVGTVIQPDQEPAPETYKETTRTNEHLHRVIKAQLKERSGQPLTPIERNLIETYEAAKRWELGHTYQEQS